MKLIINAVFFVAVAFLVDFAESSGGGNGNKTVAYKFELFEIVPYVIKKPPSDNMKVKYPDDARVELGNKLTETQVKEEPKKVSYRANHDGFYTVVFVQANDIANKKCGKGAQVLLWLVYNIKGDDIKSGEELVKYQAPAVHNFRYVYLVLRQKKYIKDLGKASIKRDCFYTQQYMKDTKSKLVAGAFFILVADDAEDTEDVKEVE